ncbi:MAG: aspartate aminotransferase family protein [Acidobacteriota bacterium]|nr:aspartate aminotransferase family protein [Acidobacteriota bacterium]
MAEPRELLQVTAGLAADYLESMRARPVFPTVDPEDLRSALGGPLPEGPTDATEVIRELAAGADPGIVASGSGGYFGFVIGGTLPAAMAADWLTSAWDQNAGIYACSPAASVVEEITRQWLLDLLGLPAGASMGFVTGTQMAHVTGLAAARLHVLEQVGWDVGRDGLTGAPRVTVLRGARGHITIDRALRLLGLGAPTLVESDSQGRMVVGALAQALAENSGPTIVCAQVGEVNTGAIDPISAIAELCEGTDRWLHVDGAFGLWASASPALRHLTAGIERADSWTTDAHKWLNAPYDSGIIACAHPQSHRSAMTVQASYLVQTEDQQSVRDGFDWTPEFSRRARVFPIYAALRQLGRAGVAAMIERSCELARRAAERLSQIPGVEVMNEVVLNQVLFRFSEDALTDAALTNSQLAGDVWLSGTKVDERSAIRLSVSNWQTDEDDIGRLVNSFSGARAELEQRP